MPNRMLKETIRTSKNVNSLTDFQFRLWIYLITYVDDYGRGSADPEILKGLVFTRRKNVTESQIKNALSDLANIGMIRTYEVEEEPYFYFPNWEKHQRQQAKKAKFPAPSDLLPESTESHGESPKVTVSHGESRWDTVSHGESRPETETETEEETEGETNYCAVISLPLIDGTEYDVTQAQVDKWQGFYPAVDVMQELRNMAGWLDGNPANRKTRQGATRFITNWLGKSQNSARKSCSNAPQSMDDYLEQMLREERANEQSRYN